MAVQSNGALAGFGWLKRGIGVGLRHPKPLLGASALLVLAIMIPALVQFLLQLSYLRQGTRPIGTSFGLIMAARMLLSLLILPLYVGFFQLIDAAERGLPARARDIFKPYQQSKVLEIIGYGLALMVLYLALLAPVISVTGSGILRWYMQILAAQASHQLPPTTLPAGFGVTAAMVAVILLFMTGVYSISLGQLALRNRGVLGALGDGLLGALKNVLPLLVFAVSCFISFIGISIAFSLIALLLILIGKFVGIWFVVAAMVPLYFGFLLLIISGSFGVMYHLWRDVCSGEAAGPTHRPLVNKEGQIQL